jgi:outer membrane receptor for ferrienterochelin and colicins
MEDRKMLRIIWFLMLAISPAYLIAQETGEVHGRVRARGPRWQPPIAQETGEVHGMVRDEQGNLLEGAQVQVKSLNLGAVAKETGHYHIHNIPAGEREITVSVTGYKSATRKVNVLAGKVVELNFVLKQTIFEMDQITITGTRTERLLRDVPVRTEIITSEDIESKGAVNFYEALEGIPGIRVEQQCSYCNFSTVRMQGLESGHVQVLIDGKPTFSGLPGVYGLQQIPASNIDRIEVVKGAGSALYGSSAIAGVINIISKSPTRRSTAEATIQLGEYGTNIFTANASTKVRDMDVMISAQKNTGDIIDINNDFISDRVWSDNVALGLRATVSGLLGDDEFSVTANTIDESRKGGLLEKPDPEDPANVIKDVWKNPFGEASEAIDTRRYEVTIGYNKDFALGNQFGIAFSYCNHNRNATNDTFLGDYMATHDDNYPPSYLLKPYIADEHIYFTDLSYSHPFVRHLLLAGFQFRRDEMEESGMYCIIEDSPGLGLESGNTYRSLSEKHGDDYGIFLQDEISITDNLELVAGVRYDSHHSKDSFAGSGKVAGLDIPEITYNENAINPRMAIMYKATSSLTIRSSLGTGFRVPYTFSEDLHLCSGSPRVYKPGGLKPEKSVSFNLGVDYLSDRCVVNANIFRTNLAHKIGFVDATSNLKSRGYDYMWQNIGDAYTQGIELGFRSLLAKDLTLGLNFTFTDAQYKEIREDWLMSREDYLAAWQEEYGEEEGTELFNQWWSKYNRAGKNSKYIPRVPRVTGGLKLEYNPGEWNLVLDCVFTGRLYIDYFYEGAAPSEIKQTAPFVVINPRISRKLSHEVSFYAGAKNLFDYVQEDKRPDDAAFMWAPYIGRTIYGGFKVTWM